MPYNTSIRTVRRHQRYLEDMIRQWGQNVTWPSSEPEVFARRLREAMTAAKVNAEKENGEHQKEAEPFMALKDFYEVQVLNGMVQAKWIGEGAEVTPSTLRRIQVDEAENLHAVVGATVKFREQANELFFPSANLPYGEMERLFKWLNNSEGGWKLISHHGEGLTLTRLDVAKELLWDPEVDKPEVVVPHEVKKVVREETGW